MCAATLPSMRVGVTSASRRFGLSVGGCPGVDDGTILFLLLFEPFGTFTMASLPSNDYLLLLAGLAESSLV